MCAVCVHVMLSCISYIISSSLYRYIVSSHELSDCVLIVVFGMPTVIHQCLLRSPISGTVLDNCTVSHSVQVLYCGVVLQSHPNGLRSA